LWAHWPLLAVLIAFAGSAVVVPTLAPVAISDDWVYIRSVERLIQEHRLWVSPIATANLVFQIAWGGLFAAVLGPSLGVMRLSSVVLWALGGAACYGLVWELTRRRVLSALGAAGLLFNPLGYALAFTFMTDAPFASLLTMSVYAFVRGLRAPHATSWCAAGALLAAAGVLVRQPGLLIPAGVLTGLLLTRRLRVDVASMNRVLLVAAPPLGAYAAYYLWLTRVNGVPITQTLMFESLLQGGWSALALHAEQMTLIEVIYAGLFLLPVVAGAVPGLGVAVRTLSVRGWLWVVAWEAFVVAGVEQLRATGHRMPLVPHFFSRAGLGPNDLLVGRAPVAGLEVFAAALLVCGLAALLLGLLVIRALDAPGRDRRGVVIVCAVLAWQAVGALVVSTYFRFWMIDGVSAPSLDRYLLPLLPLVLALGLWAVQDLPFSRLLAGGVSVALAAFAIAGTRDNIVFHETTWELARWANAQGVPNLQLDAGASWDGYYLGEYSYETVGPGPRDDPRWWLSLFAPAIDPQYVITAAPVNGYTAVREQPYRLWLDADARLFLLRRDGIPGPP
jgi:4-amino-4-deoxy-L-arabinose transferase-like glycosyltransferase